MGILDRLRGKAHQQADPAERAALAHDEAADAFVDTTQKAREETPATTELTDQDRRAAEDMTAEGDPWD